MLTLTFVINIACVISDSFIPSRVNVNNKAYFTHRDLIHEPRNEKILRAAQQPAVLLFLHLVFQLFTDLTLAESEDRPESAETGLIFSAISLVALCAQPLYGFIQDKLGLRKHLLQFLGVMLLLTGPFFIYVYAPLLASSLPLGALVGGLFIGATFFAGIGALESYTERVSRISGFEFGRARMWGSLGWASATFLAGFIFNIDPNINFWLASAAAVVFLLLLSQVRELKPNAWPAWRSANRRTCGCRTRWRCCACRASGRGGVCARHQRIQRFDQQFSVYFASQFASREQGNEMYGFLNSLQVFLEAGGMFLAPLLVNRIGAKQGLLLAGSVMALRMFGSGLVSGA